MSDPSKAMISYMQSDGGMSAYDQLRSIEKQAVDDYLKLGFDSPLLSRPLVKAAIFERRRDLTDKLDINAENVMREIKNLAYVNARDFFEDDLSLKDLGQLSRGQWAAIKKVKLTERYGKEGELASLTKEIEFHPKLAALDTLMKYMEKYAPDVFKQMVADMSPGDEYARMINQ